VGDPLIKIPKAGETSDLVTPLPGTRLQIRTHRHPESQTAVLYDARD
jgi:hypothetical protein